MNKLKNENGAITIIVLVSILFMLAFLISSYVIVANKVKTQKEIISETKRIYEKDKSMEERYNLYFKTNGDVIPIYLKEQVLKVGTSQRVQIQNKYFSFTNASNFILMNNFEVNEEDLPEIWGGRGPEFFFLKQENTGNIDYNGHTLTVHYLNGETVVYDGKPRITLSVEKGSIEISNTGYKLIKPDETIQEDYTGPYIITGTTTTNTVKIMTVGDFDITLKDLNIDLSSVSGYCAFNANYSAGPKGVNVTIKLEEENVLIGGGSASGLGFAGATPNINGETEGSTLTIEGEGSLIAQGGGYSAGIGSGYNGRDAASGDANNIIINSGNITAHGGIHGAGIGAAYNKTCNNIIINGGNINAECNFFAPGIGAAGSADNININGGNVTVTAGTYTVGIGGSGASGTTRITGGKLTILPNGSAGSDNRTWRSSIGNNGTQVVIEGGTVICKANGNAGIYEATEGVIIKGGNILSEGLGDIGKRDENNNFVQGYATDEDGNVVYLTKIHVQNVEANKLVTSFTTSDNLNYRTKDMYTMENGMLYVYLPEGTRIITVEIDGIQYSETIETLADTSTANNRLSEGYQEVEYIQANGTQWIDTGVSMNGNYTLYADGYMPSGKSGVLINGYANSNNRQGMTFFTGSNKYGYYWFGKGYTENTTLTSKGIDLKQRFQFTQSRTGLTLTQGNNSITETYSGNTNTNSQNIYIFNTSANANYKNGVIYNAKILNGTQIVKDFVPCYRISDNAIGLYDIVNNVFYTNAGSGTFIKGDNVYKNTLSRNQN